MSMRKLIAWFVGIYIVLSAVTVWVILYFLEIPRPATVADWGELAKTVGVALTLIASLMAVVGTLINAHKQIKALRDTEILRGYSPKRYRSSEG